MRMPFNSGGNEHPRRNEPSNVEADKTNDIAAFHNVAHFTSDTPESEQKMPVIGHGAAIIFSLLFGEQKRRICAVFHPPS